MMCGGIDISRAPRGVMAASSLVQAVAQAGDLAEHHYLELKGPPDLNSKAYKHKIAKFILGAANRIPEKAVTAFEGCAVMVIGITKTGVTGIPPIEIKEISEVVQPFLGAAGPRWDIVRVPVAGSTNEVLLIIVEPPQQGQPPFICRDNGEGLKDGGIYIRVDGETREAKSDEIELLIKRGETAKKLDVDFEVQVIGEINSIELDDAYSLEPYIESVKARLLSAMQRDSSKVGPKLAQGILGATLPENRTQEQYREAIEAWERDFRKAWPDAVQKLAGYVFHAPKILINNKAKTFFQDVQLQIHLEGSVFGADFFDIDDFHGITELELPRPPREWGPRPNDLFNIRLPNISNFSLPDSSIGSRLDWKNSGSVDLTLDVGDVRPRDSLMFEEEELVLLCRNYEKPPSFHGTWNLTAKGFHEVFAGDLDVEVADSYDFTGLCRAVLGLDRKHNEDDSDDD